MDLHRLRVVEFDTSVSEKEGAKKYIAENEEYKQDWETSTGRNKNETGDESECLDHNTSPPGLSRKCPDDKICPPGTSKKYLYDTASQPGTWKKCPDDKICPPGTPEKYVEDTSTSCPGSLKKDNFTRSKSKSQIFKIQPKNKPRKRDLKINSSDLGILKLFQDSAYSHQKKRTFNLRNRNSRFHHKVENVEGKKEKNEEVHFLFARETPSFIKYCRKRARNERTTTKKKRDSELPNEIYGFQKGNRSMDQYQYRMSCFNCIDTNKIPFKTLRRRLHRKPTPPQPVVTRNCACKHHAMRVLNSVYEYGQCPSIYYNLGTHPRRSQRKRDYDQAEGFERERSRRMARDETVEVTPSSLGPVSISCRDAGTGPSKVEVSAVCRRRPPYVRQESPALHTSTITTEDDQEPSPLPCTPKLGAAHAQNKWKKKHNKMKTTRFITNVPLGFISRFARHIIDFHTKKKLTGETYIKYVFIGLLIVGCSPCLLAVILAWVVMCPVKLTSIFKTDKSKKSCPMNHSFMNRFRKKDLRCEYQRMCFENYLPKNKKSFMTSVTSWYSRTVGTVVTTLTSLLKLKRKAPMGAGSSFLPSSHPNPRKRYTLFYADNRGWVMKPLRRRNTRSSASTREVQTMRCEVRPKLRLLKKMPLKFKKVCPEHGDNSYPTHKSSAAGDACQLQSIHPWPACVCSDKYSQGSSMFKRLESRHHRRQKVNIPSTFSYPTSSGIALNSADKTINAKQFNSNDKADNIAHDDLVKYNLGQRKNGTMPFEVVFNHPRGAKHPLITNLEKFRAHKFGLAGKPLNNMSTKCTPSLVIKGLQGQLPKCCTKPEAGKAVNKSPGIHRITSFTGVTTSMPTKHVSIYRRNTKRDQALNCPSGRNHKSAIKNKKLHTLQKNLNFRNKCVLADISQSTETKQGNTSTYKINYAHKTHNTSKHVLYHKVVSKSKKTEKSKSDMASKCAKHTTPKQAYKYKTDKDRVPTQKHSSPAKIKSIIKPDTVFSKKHIQFKQGYKYNPDQIPVATQKQSNKADITTTTNRNKALNYPFEEKHKQTKHANKYKPHQIPVATQKQSNNADVTTRTNVDIAINCTCGENHEQSTLANKYKPHQVPVATQKQSNKADITTSTNRNKALNYPFGEKHKQSKKANKYKPHPVSVAIQKQSNKADITTSTNRDIALNYPCEEKNEQYKHSFENDPHQISVAIQMLSRTADNTTMTNRDIALNRPYEEKQEQYKHGYKYEPHQIPNATQMQSRIAEHTTMTNRDIALNRPYEEKYEQYNHGYKYEPHQISNATQMQSRIADNTSMTNRDIALNRPYEEKHEQFKHGYKNEPHQILNSTQTQSRTADNTVMINRDTSLNRPYEEKHEQYKHGYKYEPHQIANTTHMQSRIADNSTMNNRDIALNRHYEEKYEQYKHGYKYEPHQVPNATQMQSRIADNSTMIIRDIALNRPYEEKRVQYKQGNKYEPHQIPNSTQMGSRTAENTTMTNRDIAFNRPNAEKHEQYKHGYKYEPHQIPNATQMQSRIADNTTMTNRDITLNRPYEEKRGQYKQGNKYEPHQITNATQMQSRTADNTTMTNRDIALNRPYEEKHGQYKQGNKYEPHQITNAIQMQSRIADNTTITNRDIALNRPYEEKYEQYKQGNKYEPHQITNATQMQSRTAEHTTMTNRDIALNRSYEEKHGQYKQGNKHEPHQITNATQMQSRTAENTTMTNRDIALNRPNEEEHEQYKRGYKYEPHQIPNSTQIQSRIADNTTMTNRDIALNRPYEEKYEQYKHGYIYEPHQIPNATQMQSRTAENTTMTNRDIALNRPYEEKYGQYKQGNKYEPHQITNATQMQSRTADNTTMTNRDIALNRPNEEKHEQYKHDYKYEPHQIPNSTQMQSRIADNTTMTNRDIALNRPYEEKYEQYKHGYIYEPHQIPNETQMQSRTAENMTMTNRDIALNRPYEEKHGQYKQGNKYEPHQITNATQMQSRTADNTTMTNRDIALNRPNEEKYEQYKRGYKYEPHQIPNATQMQSRTADNTTITNRDLAFNYVGAVKPSTANKEILCILSTGDKYKICTQKTSSPEYVPKKNEISIQKQTSKIETSVYCASDYERSKTKENVCPEQTVFSKKNIDCTSCCASTSCEKISSQKQTSALKKVTDWGWGGEVGGSSKLSGPCLYKGTQTIAPFIPQENKGEVEAERPRRAFTKEMVDCGCGVKPKQQTLATNCGLDNEPNLNKFLRESFSTSQTILANRTENKPVKQTPSQKSTLEIRRISTTEPLSTRQLQTDELLKQFQPHANSPLFGTSSDWRFAPQITQVASVQASSSQFKIAADCRCGVTPQQNKPDKEIEQIANDSKNTYTQKTSSAKAPSQQPRLTQASSHTLQEQPKTFGLGSNCLCGTNQPIVAEKSLYNKVTEFKSHSAKETQSKSLAIHPTTNGDNVIPHSNQNRSVDKALSKITMKETETPALKKSSITKLPKSPEPSPPHLLTSPPAQPDKDSRKTRVGTELVEYPKNLSIPQPKVSEQSRQYISQITPLTDKQGPTPDQVTAGPLKTRIVTETPPTTSTNIPELPCDCTCDCNSVERLESKSPQHIASAQPDISKIDSLHRSSQIKQSSLRTHKTTLGTDGQPEFSKHFPSVQPDIPKVDKTLSKFPKSPEHLASKISQAASTLFGIASDCRCGVTPPIGQVSNPPASKTLLGLDGQPEFSQHFPNVQPDIAKVAKTLSKFPKSLEHLPSKVSQATSPVFGIASNCRCGVTSQQNPIAVANSLYSKVTGSKSHTATKTRTKSPPALKKTSMSPPPKSLPRKCRCLVESLQDPAGEQPYDTKGSTTPSKRNIVKVDKTRSKFPKSPDHSPPPKSLPHKCRCPVGSLHDPVGEQPYGTKVSATSSERNIVKIDKTRSKFPKSPDHSPPPKCLPHTCRCPIESLQGPVREQPYVTKVNKTSSKRKSVKVDKTRLKFSKAPEHSPPLMNLPHNCACPIESMQDSVGKKTFQRSRKSVFSRKSKRKVLDFPHECPCSSSHNDLDKRCFESDISVLRDTTRQCSIRSCERTEGTCFVNERSSRVQYRSKVSRLVMSLRSKLFSRKISKQTKIPENLTKKPPPEIFSSLQVNPKKVDKSRTRRSTLSPYLSNTSCHWCHCTNDDTEKISVHTCKSILDDKSNKSFFRRRHMSKTSQNPSSAIHSSHSIFHNSCECVIHQNSTRQCTKKNRYIRKPLIVDKSYSCLSLSKTSQRLSFLSHSSKLKCRCHADTTSSLRLSKISCYSYPRLSQRIRSQQSKTSEHSSIVKTQTPIECSSDETFSTPKDGMSHQILKTLFKRNSHSKSRQLTQRNRSSQFSAYFNRSQEKLSEKQSILTQSVSLSHTILTGMCRCAAKHLGKTTSRQSYSRPQQLPNHKHFIRSQKPTSLQKQFSKKFVPLYSSSLNNYQPKPTAKQTVPWQHPLSSEPLNSDRSFLFNLSQSKPLVEKIRSITDNRDMISSNSRNNKQKKTSSTVGAQTALTFPSKCACWPEKLHQLSKKLSQLSRKSVEKTSPSETSPHMLSAQTTPPDKMTRKSKQEKTSSTLGAPPIIQSKCACWPEKLHQLSKIISQPSRKFVEKTTQSKTSPHLLSAQQTQPNKISHQTRARTEPQAENPQHLSIRQPKVSKQYLPNARAKQLSEKVEIQFDAIPQQPKAEQVISIISGKCRCAGEQKMNTEYSSSNILQPNTDLQKLSSIQHSRSPNSHSSPTDNQIFPSPTASHSTRKPTLGIDGQPKLSQHLPSVQPDISKIDSHHRSSQSIQLTEKFEKEFDAIPQQTETEPVIPIISGKCRCAGEQNVKTERSSNNKLQQIQASHSPNSNNLSTDTQRFQTSTVSHPTHKSKLRTDGRPELSQHLPSVQPDISKIDSLLRSSQSKQLTENFEKEFDAIPQQTETEPVIPIISGKCRCAGEQNVKTERSSKNKLQQIQSSHSPNSHSLSTDTQRIQSSTVSHPTHKSNLRTDGLPELSQHLPSVQPDISKIDSLHHSFLQSKQLTEKVEKQFDAISQQAEAEQVIPIISGKCRCAGEQNVKTERSSNNKLQRIRPVHSPNSHSLRTNNQRFQSHTASYPTRKSTPGTDKQPEFSTYLPNQPLETPASKLSQPHPRQQVDIPHSAPLHNFQPKRKKPCKCRSFKHGNEQEIPNSLHKIAKAQSPGMSQYYSEKFQKSHLVSCVYPVTAKKQRLREHVIIQRSGISQSSENPQFQPNPQIQVYQQKLHYQKRLSQIPTNLDKPPPGLLQQYSPGLGRTGTAEGGVQQPYPDFNRVYIRYPGYDPPRKQSEPIPGVNRQSPTNNYPPAPRPPPKYARDPCCTSPPNRCAPKSPYDESALRRAYKRRPLRYTPPRQQLPRVIMEKKLKENKKKAAAAKKRKAKRFRNKTFFQCLRDLINQTEREAWPTEIKCHPMWLNTLKQRPCFWIYNMCPRMYPAFLKFYKYLQYIGQMFIYLLTLCFWSPLLLCGYFCCDVMCRS